MSESSKLLKSFEVSAPGKVILHGEHSVVYGQPALAGAIGLRNYIKFEETNAELIHIVFDKIDIDYTIQLKVFNLLLLKYTNELQDKILPEYIDHTKFLDEITQWLNRGGNILNQKQINTLAPTIYLLLGILIDNKVIILNKGFKLISHTDMSIGAGLGSSASFGVCLSATFFILTKFDGFFQAYSHYSMEDKLKLQNYIIKWSFCLEKVMHGNPSGLDNTICTYGGCVTFTKGTQPEIVLINHPINILLVDTKVTRSTSKLVADVAALNTEHPNIMKSILSAMGCLVTDALTVLTSITSLNDFTNFEKVARLVKINNNLLRAIGVSHPELEKIFNISEKHGFASKLTGAGGGGYAIIFLPPEYKLNEAYGQLCAELNMNYFDFIETTVGGKGVDFAEN